MFEASGGIRMKEYSIALVEPSQTKSISLRPANLFTKFVWNLLRFKPSMKIKKTASGLRGRQFNTVIIDESTELTPEQLDQFEKILGKNETD